MIVMFHVFTTVSLDSDKCVYSWSKDAFIHTVFLHVQVGG